jgi:hypothetical protein
VDRRGEELQETARGAVAGIGDDRGDDDRGRDGGGDPWRSGDGRDGQLVSFPKVDFNGLPKSSSTVRWGRDQAGGCARPADSGPFLNAERIVPVSRLDVMSSHEGKAGCYRVAVRK